MSWLNFLQWGSLVANSKGQIKAWAQRWWFFKLLDATMILEKNLWEHSGMSRGGRAKSSISLNFGAERLIWYFPLSIFQMGQPVHIVLLQQKENFLQSWYSIKN